MYIYIYIYFYVGMHVCICVCTHSYTNIKTGAQTRKAMMTLPLSEVISMH